MKNILLYHDIKTCDLVLCCDPILLIFVLIQSKVRRFCEFNPKMSYSPIIILFAIFALGSSELYIAPTTNSTDCVVNECMTINQLFFIETNISSNVTLLLLEGDHVVNFSIFISDRMQFRMLPFDDTKDEYNVRITCDFARFVFTNVSTIDIRGITFVDCEGTEFESINELKITTTTFTGRNTRRSTLSIKSSVAHVTNTRFISVLASIFDIFRVTHYGGAIAVTNTSLEIDSCVFMGNRARFGGAISSGMDSEIVILNSDFISNRAMGLRGIPLPMGGAIFVNGTSAIVISNNTFENNTSHLGGALAIVPPANLSEDKSTHVIERTTFRNNHAITEGGLLYINRSDVTFTNCIISYNSALERGGAIASNYSSVIRLINSQVISNSAEMDGGVIVMQHNCTVIIDNSTFEDNSVRGNGGVVCAQFFSVVEFTNDCLLVDNSATFLGGVAVAKNDSSIVVESCIFQNNSARSGGVFHATDYTDITVTDSRFSFNRVNTYGGVFLSTYNSSIQIDNSTFTDNVANFIGGVLRLEQSCSVIANKSNFSYNRAAVYGGVGSVQVNNTVLFIDSSFRHNSIVTNGGGVLDMNILCTANMYRCNFENNTAGVGGVVLILRNSRLTLKDSVLIGSQSKVDVGGSIRASQRNEVIIRNCHFFNHLANYGGVFATALNNTIDVTNSTFDNNSATGDGGVMYIRNIGHVSVTNSLFTNNQATNNGIIQVADSCSMTLNSVTFIKNTVLHDGGAAYAYLNSNASVDNCTFINNTAGNSGGTVYVRNKCNLTMSNCTLIGNRAQNSGGCIHGQDDSHVYVDSSSFTNNTGDTGGGIRMYVLSFAEVTNCNFSGNVARVAGGAMASYEQSSITIYGCNLVYNKANAGGGLAAFQSNENTSVSDEDNVRTPRQNMMEINKNNFVSNSAGYGGSVYLVGSVAHVRSSSFARSRARYSGGDINANTLSNISIYDSDSIDSEAGTSGGVISLFGQSYLDFQNCLVIRSTAIVDGGTVILGQSDAQVINCTFQSCSANSDGGVFRALDSTLHLSNSTLSNSTANQRGGAIYATTSVIVIELSTISYSRAVNGSGGAFYCTVTSRCIILQSAFEHNQGQMRGGTLYVKDSSNADIQLSNITSNEAEYGGALAARESGSIFLDSVQVQNNKAVYGGGIFLSDSSVYFETLRLGESHVSVNNATSSGGGIYADNSSISFRASVEFVQNRAESDGGGIFLLRTQVDNDARIRNTVNFTLNRATHGGALFVSDNSYANVCPNNPRSDGLRGGCFFQNVLDNFTFNFVDNLANAGGSDLYGGLLDRCEVADRTNFSRLEPNGFQQFQRISNIINFDRITSSPVRVCLCNVESQPNCDQQTYYVQVRQRNGFVVPIAAIDHVNHLIPATVEASFNNISLPQSQRIQSIDASCSNITYRVSFQQITMYNLTLFPQGPCGDKGISTLSVVVSVVDCSCPPGLIPSESNDECACVCDDRFDSFADRISSCDPIEGTIERQGQFWIKYFGGSDESGVHSPYFIHPFCPYDYCVPPSPPVSIDLSLSNGSDAQCANDRGGLLCGRCLEGYSLSLGSSKCLQCSKSWHGPFAGILITFIIAGVLLVISLLIFNVTVAVGTINSIVFFANILNVNQSEYFRQPNLAFVPVFISWLNLDIGFDTCFIDGMDTYMKTWLQLAFPLYIIMLVFLIIWISSCSIRFSKLIGKKNPVATLATLILLSYTKLLQVMIASFSFVNLTFPNGQRDLRWLRDPNIEYKSGKLIALVIVAIIILLVGLIYTALLFCWQWLLPLSKYKLFSWTKNQKRHTFIETYNTPYTPKHRYWTALFLIVRVLLYLISALNESTDPRVTLMCTIIIMVCVIIYKTLWTVTIYKNVILNAIESFVLFNIITFSVVTLYTFTGLDQVDKQALQTVAAYLSVGSVMVICLLVIVYHIYRYGSSKVYTKVSNSKAGQRLARKLTYNSSPK